ncbi:MAG: ATP-binding protein [Formivibrio sp.]|nr:ATP-binding protein [Formivibrio sp.]
MRQVFLRFYFTVAVCFLIAALLIGSAYKQLVDRANQRYLTDIFTATISIIERELGDLPPSLWHDEVKRIADKIPVPVQVEALDSYVLSPVNQNALKDGDIILLYDQDLYLHRIHQTDVMVVLGPIPFLSKTDRISWEDIMALFLMCLSLGIPAWLWLRPLWRDLLVLTRQGRRLGEGDFTARVALEENSALALLGGAFNRMAHDVEELTSSRRAMIDAVSHDLRTPLARLRYRLEAIKAGANIVPAIAAIERDITSIDQLIEEWLTMSSLDKPEMQMERLPLEIVPWLERLVAEYSFEGGPVEVINQTAVPSPVVEVDSYYLGRVIGNLLNNALRYGGKRVRLTLLWVENVATLHIDDDGPGIPESERARLLLPFERLEASRNRSTGGFGLGLAIVAMVLRAHGGNVAIDASPWGGARVTLAWPTPLRDAGF